MEFSIYKKFYEKERADSLSKILADNGIASEMTEDGENLDSLYGDKQFSRQFFVKIKQSDFEQANAILLKLNESELETVDKDHYLFGFADEELFEILSKPDEWNEFDFLLAKKILKERGKEINTETVDLLKKQRIKELATPEGSQRNWIYAGYVLALFGGLLGIFIGWHLSSFKKTLPNGQRVYAYTEQDRRGGTRLLIVSTVMFLLWLIARLVNDYSTF